MIGCHPVYLAENLLNRAFDSATALNQIWCTDVTEFKYGYGKKEYLSAIAELWDKSIIAYVLSVKNDSVIVMETLKQAFETNKEAHPWSIVTETFNILLTLTRFCD